MTSDRLEFYHNGKPQPFLTLDSSFQPNDGDLVNIRKATYKVIGRSFTVDSAGTREVSIRCNVILEPHKP
jgi:hypothetical protein